MAEKIIGIKLNDIDYDYEDEETSQQAQENAEAIGDLSTLETEEKSSLVGAINELVASGGGGGEPVDVTAFFNNAGHSGDFYPQVTNAKAYPGGLLALNVVAHSFYANTGSIGSSASGGVGVSDLEGFSDALKSVWGENFTETISKCASNSVVSNVVYITSPMAMDFMAVEARISANVSSGKLSLFRLTLGAYLISAVALGTHSDDTTPMGLLYQLQ